MLTRWSFRADAQEPPSRDAVHADLAGADLIGYCNHMYTSIPNPFYWSTGKPILLGTNAGGWRCVFSEAKTTYHTDSAPDIDAGTDLRDIDMQDVCHWQYGNGAYAKYTNYNDPGSWRCYSSGYTYPPYTVPGP